MNRPLVAITGATGFVGSNVIEYLATKYEVIALVRSKPADNFPYQHHQVDFQSQDSLSKSFAQLKPDVVLHLAISNEFNKLFADPVFAEDAYIGMTKRVLAASESIDAHFVYISTDWVFSGVSHMVAEDTAPDPVNIYGELKSGSEEVVKASTKRWAICRIGGVMGSHRLLPNMPRSQDVGFGYFVASIVDALSAGQEFLVWQGDGVNEIATVSLASEIAASLARVIDQEATGIFHLVGSEAITKRDLAHAVCDVFNLDANLLKFGPAPSSEKFPQPVPKDSSLDSTKTRSTLGLEFTSPRVLLAAFKTERETGRLSPLS